MMPSSLSRIFGWAPPSDESFLDVDVPDQPLHHQLPAFHISENDAMQPSSPASSTSGLSDGHPERRTETTSKKGDPTWIARPRNEFILFRCDYVRRHTKEGGNKRSRRAPGQEVEKTLSKLAAEAWRALPTEDRAYWREQANLERTDHARKYPDYRYRPKKSMAARKRQSRSSMSASVVTKSAPAPALLDRVTVDAISGSPSYDSPIDAPLVERTGSLYFDNSLRKSTSVPLLSSNGAIERQGDWMPLSVQPIQNFFDSRTNSTGINAYHQAYRPSLQHSRSYDSINLATPALSESMSIAGSTASSLINWNGEPPILSPQPTSYLDPLSIPIQSNFGSDSMHVPHKFIDAISGGYPSLQMLNGFPPRFQQPSADTHWVPRPYAPDDNNTLVRTSRCNGLREEFMSSFPVFDSMGRASHEFRHMSSRGMPEESAVIGVIPGEYLTSSAEMTPDEVFSMDRDEYFAPY